MRQTPVPTPTLLSPASPISPMDWPWARATPPTVASEKTCWNGALLRSWRGTACAMIPPPLDHHCVVMHLDGPERVDRIGEGASISMIEGPGSLTIVPAGTACLWRADGPIGFAHLYLRPRELTRLGGGTAHGDGNDLRLIERVAFRDHVLEPVFKKMLHEIGSATHPSELLLDSLLESLCVRLAQKHSIAPEGRRQSNAESLAPHRLRRVLEVIDTSLALDISLRHLADVAGTSRFHFSRAFRLAMGLPPHRYVIRRRIEYGMVLLMTSADTLSIISRRCGFSSERQFSVMFKQIVGESPKRYRTARGIS